MDYTYEQIARMIDHSLLQPQMSDPELEAGCDVAAKYQVASVCIKPYFVKRAAELLEGSGVAVGTTVGFPHGGHTTAVKLFEAQKAIEEGATELDMVVNIGWVLAGRWERVGQEIKEIVELAHGRGALVKVIFENCYLEREHIIRLCELSAEANADFVKTSTGYGTGGATVEDVKLMREHTPAHIGVKAAGGVRSLDALLQMRQLGCTRIGASRTVEILEECKRRLAAAK